MIKLATIFSGIGAVEQAFEKDKIDHEIVFACDNGERELKETKEEILKDTKNFTPEKREEYVNELYNKLNKLNYMEMSYKKNYKIADKDFHQDVRFINGKKYEGKVDLLVGGSPCQSFSIIGKRGGFKDTRGTLFYEYARLVNEIRPKVFIFENVKGMLNHDKGKTWEYGTKIAKDKKVSFNETSMYETPNGDLIAFMRSEAFGDQACIARSIDGGKTFGEWKSMGFKGHPLQAMRLPDNRVLLTYGYRHEPCGVRARILNAECTDYATAPEIIIRDDADDGDVGYTWAVQLDEKRVLVVYYINFDRAKGTRHIQGSILEIEPQG